MIELRALRAARSFLDPRAWAHLLRLVHFYNYSHVEPKRKVTLGKGVRLSPNVSFRNGSRITIGSGAHIGGYCNIWAGDSVGRIDIGENALFGPNVFVTASDYDFDKAPGLPVMGAPKRERDVRIGSNVWLGANVVVVAGVTIGDGSVIGAGSVVTSSIPPSSIAGGIPARVIRAREGA